ncbi:MAG: hypothetical protein AABZ47_18615 [Planctomycetota bacterium]
MKKLRFLLLDANVIIKLFELKLWEQVIERCEIFIAETVANEAQFFHDDVGQEAIDLSAYSTANKINVVSLTASDVAEFRDRFTPDYMERIDPGEAEALAYLLGSKDPCLLCSADAIVFRILGRLSCGEQGISLEEILQRTGLSTTVPIQYRRAFRDHWTKVGQQDMIRNVGLK